MMKHAQLASLRCCNGGSTRRYARQFRVLGRSCLLAERSRGAKTHSQKLSVSDGDVGTLLGPSGGDPERARSASPTARLHRTAQHHDVLICRVRVDRNDRA